MRMTEQEFQSRYRILILEPTMNVETFHCGDEDLDDFIVHEANFYGVARIAGQQRVVVELFDGYLVATAYIPKEAIKNCITSQKNIIST